MPVGKGGNLRKVRYDEDLGDCREGGEAATDLDRCGPADAGVDLVEDEGGYGIRAGEDHLDGEHHPGKLAPRGAALNRPGRCTGMRAQQYLHVIDTSRTEHGVPPVDLESVPPPRLGDLLLRHRDGDDGMRHGERTQFRGDRRAESVSGGTSGGGHLGGEPGQLRAYLCSLRAQGVDPLVVALE